jgi:hypothetical protein
LRLPTESCRNFSSAVSSRNRRSDRSTDFFFADAVAALDPEHKGPRFFFQRVPEPKVAKNRMHLDVPAGEDALDDAVSRLVERGATFVEFGAYAGHRWAVMRDPEGNEFCVQD